MSKRLGRRQLSCGKSARTSTESKRTTIFRDERKLKILDYGVVVFQNVLGFFQIYSGQHSRMLGWRLKQALRQKIKLLILGEELMQVLNDDYSLGELLFWPPIEK